MIKRIKTVEEALKLIDEGKEVVLMKRWNGEAVGEIVNYYYPELIDTAKWYREDGYDVYETLPGKVFTVSPYAYLDTCISALGKITR